MKNNIKIYGLAFLAGLQYGLMFICAGLAILPLKVSAQVMTAKELPGERFKIKAIVDRAYLLMFLSSDGKPGEEYKALLTWRGCSTISVSFPGNGFFNTCNGPGKLKCPGCSSG